MRKKRLRNKVRTATDYTAVQHRGTTMDLKAEGMRSDWLQILSLVDKDSGSESEGSTDSEDGKSADDAQLGLQDLRASLVSIDVARAVLMTRGGG